MSHRNIPAGLDQLESAHQLEAAESAVLTIIVNVSISDFARDSFTIALRSSPSALPVREGHPLDLPTPRELYRITW